MGAAPLTSQQFFLERIEAGAERIWLEGPENHHLARVARIRAGESVWLFDRSGRRFPAEVEEVGRDRSRLRLVGPAEERTPGLGIVLGQAVIKPANMDLVVRKAVELGATTIVPVVTARSLPGPPSERGRKVERWRKIALEAAKQSLRAAPPAVEPPTALNELVARYRTGRRLRLSEGGGVPLRNILAGPGRPEAAVLLTGPEGGWTEGEEKALEAAGFEAVSLGRTILRAETATIAALGMIAHFWSD